MSDPSLIADLVRAGLDAELVGRVANALMDYARDASRDASRFVTVSERSPAAIRAARYRENLKQKQGGAKANDVAQPGAEQRNGERDASRDERDGCTLLTINKVRSINEVREEKKGRKKEGIESARARGTRLPAGAILTEPFRQAALELGAAPEEIPDMWAEFTDYWPAVPGHRGVKLDWLLTWRNNVRKVLKFRGKPNGHGPAAGRRQSLSDLAFDLAEQARSAEREAGISRPDDPLRKH